MIDQERPDILITDASSVAFEYTLLDRPIVFFPYDLQDYLRLSARASVDESERQNRGSDSARV